MTKRKIDHQRAARASVHLILSNGGGAFYLLLASRTAPYSQAREAMLALGRLVEERVREHLTRVLATTDFGDAERALLIERKTSTVTARVTALLPRCASRSPGDFGRWLDREIADAVEDDEDPHGGPAAPSPASGTASSWALHNLPLPRAERDSLVAAVLDELTPEEREILGALREPQASWVDVAAALDITMFEAKRRHQQANARAHEIGVRIAMRATETADWLHTERAA